MHAVTFSPSVNESPNAVVSPVSRLAPASSQRQVDSRALFGSAQEVRIEHHGQEYRLRQTRNGKLILTK